MKCQHYNLLNNLPQLVLLKHDKNISIFGINEAIRKIVFDEGMDLVKMTLKICIVKVL